MPGYAGGTGAIGGANPAVGVNFSQPSNIPPLAAPPPGNTSAPLLNAQQQQQPGLTTILPVPAPSLVTGKNTTFVLQKIMVFCFLLLKLSRSQSTALMYMYPHRSQILRVEIQ